MNLPDLQVVHYTAQQSFGMHHDSSAFQPRGGGPAQAASASEGDGAEASGDFEGRRGSFRGESCPSFTAKPGCSSHPGPSPSDRGSSSASSP